MAIKHTISVESKSHEMVLKCFKDSVRTPYPSEEDGLLVGIEDDTNINIYKEDERIASRIKRVRRLQRCWPPMRL